VEGAKGYLAQMRLDPRNSTRSCPSKKAERIYYHLGRDRAFNETLLKHWQQLMATYQSAALDQLQL